MILAIDPGSDRSAWVVLDGYDIVDHGLEPNEELLERLRRSYASTAVVIEWTAPRGMPASAQLFETLWWAGRFAEAARPSTVERVNRLDVKRHLCGRTAARDSNVIAALIDRYGGIGGKAAAVGTKASPGPLYGVKRDIWQALAVGLTYLETKGEAA